MTLKKSYRQAIEQKYKDVNESKESVCCGMFYIKNQKKHEYCRNCSVCQKYLRFKTNRSANFEEVHYHFVDSFRECQIYKEKFEMPIKDTNNLAEETSEKKNKVVVKTRTQLAAEAYLRLEKEHPKLLMYVTWSEVFAICVLNKVLHDTDQCIRQDKVFKRQIKHDYNIFWDKYNRYFNYLKNKCFIDGDNAAIEEVVNDIAVDFFKFRIAIENFINKFKVENSNVMSHLLLSMEVMDEIEQIHRENIYNIQKKEPNAIIFEFMSPKPLITALDIVISQVGRHHGESRNIDLNDDVNIVNGVKVLYNKIRNPNIISEIIYKVEQYHINKKTK